VVFEIADALAASMAGMKDATAFRDWRLTKKRIIGYLDVLRIPVRGWAPKALQYSPFSSAISAMSPGGSARLTKSII